VQLQLVPLLEGSTTSLFDRAARLSALMQLSDVLYPEVSALARKRKLCFRIPTGAPFPCHIIRSTNLTLPLLSKFIGHHKQP
jgi:hypothetical protein